MGSIMLVENVAEAKTRIENAPLKISTFGAFPYS